MSAPAGDPAYKAATWSLGYQARQFGVAGPSIYEGLATPPAAMATAVADPEYPQGTTEAQPIYGMENNPELREVKELPVDPVGEIQ